MLASPSDSSLVTLLCLPTTWVIIGCRFKLTPYLPLEAWRISARRGSVLEARGSFHLKPRLS